VWLNLATMVAGKSGQVRFCFEIGRCSGSVVVLRVVQGPFKSTAFEKIQFPCDHSHKGGRVLFSLLTRLTLSRWLCDEATVH